MLHQYSPIKILTGRMYKWHGDDLIRNIGDLNTMQGKWLSLSDELVTSPTREGNIINESIEVTSCLWEIPPFRSQGVGFTMSSPPHRQFVENNIMNIYPHRVSIDGHTRTFYELRYLYEISPSFLNKWFVSVPYIVLFSEACGPTTIFTRNFLTSRWL